MNNQKERLVTACASIELETKGTERASISEFKKKVKVLQLVAKALGLTLWIDEELSEEV